MNLKELGEFICHEAKRNAVGWIFLILCIAAFVWGMVALKNLTDEGQIERKRIVKEHSLRENWCYEKGYFEVVHLEKLNKGYVCVDARDVTEIRTLVIPYEVSE